MPSKKKRLEKILEIIRTNDVETQEELAAFLRQAGYDVTQATVSRDIRQLRLLKHRAPSGHQRYAAPDAADTELSDKYVRVMKDGLVSLEQAQNILVIKTVSGMAMAVAAALDALKFPEVVGCIAGDDTIMAAVRTVEDTTLLIRKIRGLTDK